MEEKFNDIDLALFNKVNQLFNENVIYILKNEDLRMFKCAYLDDVFSFSIQKDDPNNKFVCNNTNFIDIYEKLLLDIIDFRKVVECNTTPRNDNPKFVQVCSSSELDCGRQEDKERYLEEIKELNFKATNLFDSYTKFNLKGKKMIKDKTSETKIFYNGDIHNSQISNGNNNTLNYTNTEYDEKINDLLKKIDESDLEDKSDIVSEINNKKEDEKELNKFLGSLLTRGSEVTSIVAAIGTILSL